MLVVVTYDVSVTDPGGPRRLNRVAKVCERYGQRVQNSVFECLVDQLTFTQMKSALLKTIDEEMDSLRFYNLGDNYKSKVTHVGTKNVLDLKGPLIF
ncbi:CRISPR-associated endonuclease Cas2 [Schleiferilactobacillus shenzhenensis]|nr:CRISPR-associated endonuclease Cas2 [Schleiferilactobacillus shenzhenensis]